MSSTDPYTSSSFARKGEARFCPYCGTRLDMGAKFCKNCGESIAPANQGAFSDSPADDKTVKKKPITERKVVYEGYIHKCPNCGEVLDSFVAKCPSCGCEIRDGQVSNSVQEFASHLGRIEAQRMPTFIEKKSVMKMVFGRDFKEKDEAKEAKNKNP